MRRTKLLSVILAMTVFAGSLRATEFRSPLIVERGPLRYVFEEWEEKDYGLKMWTAGYTREAHKAFLKHGTDSKELSALFFNKSDFYMNEILPDSYADIQTEYYSPYLAITKLSPRVTYEEKGISMGARFAYPIYKNKGRIGVRAQVPFRRIEIEREDLGDKDTNQLDDVLTKEVVTRGSTEGGTEAKDVLARAIRMDFLQSILYTANNETLLSFDATTGQAKIAGEDAGWHAVPANRMAAIIHSPEGQVPKKPDRYLGIHQDAAGVTTPYKAPTNLPADGGVTDDTQYAFRVPAATDTTNYTPLNMHTGTIVQKLAAQQSAAKLWVTSVHENSSGLGGLGGTSLNNGSTKLWSAVDALVQSYHGNIYEWLEDRNFVFESETRAGIGDIDLDFFYEHMFNEDLVGEVMVGVRFPTGANSDFSRNPYRPHLGNGEHFEIKIGGMIAWQPLDWMNVKFDTHYSFVLEGSEKRAAAFKGASIKNIGPATDADVDWGYFVGKLDLNLFHPKTDAISSVIGYELYYKAEDNIKFKNKTMESWLGQKWDTTLATPAWVENKQELDSGLAEKNTEAIAHKLRFETSFRISKWFELYSGGSYTFAGQNVPRETDMHGGFVVTF
ncbi:hypothetical protein KAU11_09505 [Candidatus Babeliales bacterium]|nr:hypothetical protein [Candidatus Babeliales bacterium]